MEIGLRQPFYRVWATGFSARRFYEDDDDGPSLLARFFFLFFYEYYPFSGRFSRYLGRIYVIGLAVSIFIEFDWL